MEHHFEAYCANCSAGLKNIFYFRGKTYGSECIKKVTGQNLEYWERFKGSNVIDEISTAQRELNRQAEQALQVVEAKELESILAERKIKYSMQNAWLIECMNRHAERSDFCKHMGTMLETRSIHSETFSARVVQVMADIYAKDAGRKGSRAYDKAHCRFWNMVESEGMNPAEYEHEPWLQARINIYCPVDMKGYSKPPENPGKQGFPGTFAGSPGEIYLPGQVPCLQA